MAGLPLAAPLTVGPTQNTDVELATLDPELCEAVREAPCKAEPEGRPRLATLLTVCRRRAASLAPSARSWNRARRSEGEIRVAGQRIQAWDDEHFSQLRAKHGVSEDFLETSLDIEACKMITEGKGGSPLYVTTDEKYILKEVSPEDHRILRRISGSYIARQMEGETLLCPIYLHFKMRVSDRRLSTMTAEAAGSMASRTAWRNRIYIAMRNLTPGGPWGARYDLKACADDKTLELDGQRIRAVHKRWWRFWMWGSRCFWTDDRQRYFEGKIRARHLRVELPEAHRDEMVHCIADDTSWLSMHGLMDYSLLIGVRRFPVGACTTNGVDSRHWQNGRRRGSVAEYANSNNRDVTIICIGIIDFLQPWDFKKKLARLLKFLEWNKATIPPAMYGERFALHISKMLRAEGTLKTHCGASPGSPLEVVSKVTGSDVASVDTEQPSSSIT